MKKLVLIGLFFIVYSTLVNAQDTNYDKPLRSKKLYSISLKSKSIGFIYLSSHFPVKGVGLDEKTLDSIKTASTLVMEGPAFITERDISLINKYSKNSDGRRLIDLIGEERFSKLSEINKELKLENIEQWDNLNPFVIISRYQAICSFSQKNEKIYIPDTDIKNIFIKDKKRIYSIESTDDQISWIHEIKDQQWQELVDNFTEKWKSDKSCKDLIEKSKHMFKMFEQGTADEIASSGNDIFKYMGTESIFKKYFIDNRNELIAIKINNIIKITDNPFFLIGALHGGGENGVISRLMRMGFTLELVEQ